MSFAETLLLLIGIAIFLLAMLGTLANVVRNDTGVHDLKIRVATLRNNYRDQIRDKYGIGQDDDAIPEAIPIDERRGDDETPPAERAA